MKRMWDCGKIRFIFSLEGDGVEYFLSFGASIHLFRSIVHLAIAVSHRSYDNRILYLSLII